MKRAKFVSKQTVYMRNEDARQQIEREKKKKNPSPIRFGIYLKIEYPCSKNAIPPPTFEIRVETFSSFSPHRTVGHNFAHTITPFRLVTFFFFLFAKKSFLRFSLSSNKKKGSYFKIKCERERRG